MLSRVQKSGVFVAAGQVDRACSREDVFASRERFVIFHIIAYQCFCPALALLSSLCLQTVKCKHFSPCSATYSHHLSPSLISHPCHHI